MFVSFRGVGPVLAVVSILAATAGHAADPGARPFLRLAQNGLPPADIPGAGGDDNSGDPAGLVVKVERLENQLRAANGQIEQLQFQQHQLEDQLKRLREDMEFRFGQIAGAQPSPGVAPAPGATAPQPVKPKRADAFDPATADPNAPGAPMQLGKTPPSQPLGGPEPVGPLPRGPLPEPPEAGGPAVIAGPGPPDDPREVYKAAMEAYGRDQFDQAEQQFRGFLARNARSPLAPDATYYLGETYLKRNRMREAAEQYLALSTNYAKSPLAPNAMVRLAQSLAALDNNPQACATLGEIDRRYPNATQALKRVVESEKRKDHCS